MILSVLPTARFDQPADHGGEHSSRYASKWAIIKDELNELGLTSGEVDIYTLLARSGVKKAGEVSRILKIPKTETYVNIANLKRKGIIKATTKRPVRFEALPFEETFRVLIREKKAEIGSLERSATSLLNVWRSLPLETTGEVSPQQFQKLEGLPQVYCKAGEMILKAVNELIIMAPVVQLTLLETYGLMDDIHASAANGVGVGILTEPGFHMAADEEVNVVWCSWAEGPLPYLILVDRKELLAMAGEDLDSKEMMALWTNCSTLCTAIHLFFAYEYSH